MNNKEKIILDLHGGTGSWSKKYKEAGYTVILVTLPEYDIFKTHISTSDRIMFSGKSRIVIEIASVYGILAAPPCTQFSLARTTPKIPRNLEKGMKHVIADLEIIWACRYKHKLKFWALENPKGILRQFLGKPAFSFQPNEFGDLYTKNTDLWGYFNAPKKLKIPLEIPDKINRQLARNNRCLLKLPEGYKEPGRRNDAARRAITSPGFAKAFYESNK